MNVILNCTFAIPITFKATGLWHESERQDCLFLLNNIIMKTIKASVLVKRLKMMAP